MSQGIVICTVAKRTAILHNVLKTFNGYHRYPIYIVINDAGNEHTFNLTWLREFYRTLPLSTNHFELGAIKAASEHLDEFFFLHDTCEVKDLDIFDAAFSSPFSVAYGPYFSGYIGKYRREILSQMEIPLPTSKDEAIEQEFKFTRAYAALDGNVLVMDPTFKQGPENRIVERYGRKNLLIEGKWLRKYQGTWGEWVGEIPT
jgi:hypothetical protein